MDNREHRIIIPTTDSYTCSNPEKVQVIHTELELNVDFPRKVLTGNAILTLQRIQINPPINEIILDILGLRISNVTNASDGIPLSYEIGINYNFGSSLRIVLQGSQDIDRIQIEYETFSSEYFPEYNSPALLWLTSAQTANGRYPFLLSNNKLIYARSWFPCQDTPSVKFTYTARISVPKDYTVLMSAIRQNINRDSPDLNVYEFKQRNPVPSYAVVIAVGSLPCQRFYGSRVFMYGEGNSPHFAKFRLPLIEQMLGTAAILCGPYLWEKYVICVLPPSIAHLEIECPCLTFIPRTILGADRSHISKYFARNIAQSWAGNLVTCLSWEHLWLNKSFSTFISRKIICQTEGNNMSDFLQQKGLRNLNKMIQNPRNFGLIRCLVPNMAPWSPHTVTKYVPYELGCKLLDYLQSVLGPRVFESFLRDYFARFALRSINTQNWIDYLSERFPYQMEMLFGQRNVQLYSWFNIIPPISNVPNRSLLENHCFELANRLIEWNCDAYPDDPEDIPDLRRPAPFDLRGFIFGENLYDVQKMIFLKSLHSSHTKLTIKKLRYLYHFFLGSRIRNGEIRYFWLLLCIKVQWYDKILPALNFAIENCSPNYACPIFQHLCEWSILTRASAIERYSDNRNKMLVQTWELLLEILRRIPRQN